MDPIPTDASARRKVALDRVDTLIAGYDFKARTSWRSYYVVQTLTVALAAITPCLIFLAKDNPRNDFLTWLQLFFPALAAITAGASHIFHWREDGVRYTSVAETLRSEAWRYQTRAGDYGTSLTDDQALDHFVTRADDVILHALAQWTADRLAAAAAGATAAASKPSTGVPAPEANVPAAEPT